MNTIRDRKRVRERCVRAYGIEPDEHLRSLCSSTITIALDHGDPHIILRNGRSDIVPALLSLAQVLSAPQKVAGPHLGPVEVRLLPPEFPCKGGYFGFFRCPLHFNAHSSAILFSRTDLKRPLPAGNRELAHAIDQILTEFLSDLHQDDLITRAKTAIAQELPSGSATDDAIAQAQAASLSPRTLHRRPEVHDTTYSKLLEAVRRELAEHDITDPSLTLSEISFLLGFSEPSAFSRASRRWTGQTFSGARFAAS